jgi:16S rRNA (cytosine1402-N4)-methyltransferase
VRARHESVLLAEVLDLFAPVAGRRGAILVDCTLGLGGHAAALLERFPAAALVGIDRDRRALELAAQRLAPFGERVRLARGRFSELERTLDALGVGRVQGILADLGVSSMQLDTAGRGFSFQHDGPLDMRMGGDEEGEVMTAHEVLRSYSEKELRRLLRLYGEELNARQIARAIVECRAERPLETTGELRRLIEQAKPAPRRGRKSVHPATQTFQALRIEVNRELDELRELLDQSVRRLESDGRLVLISYHSLEDRMVKHTLRHLATGEIEPVTGRPRAETRVIEVLTRKVVRPGAEEVSRNPRGRSARLRAARRL